MSHGPAYYNEIDPYAAQWLRNLIAEGLIAPGDVDERSIVDVRPDDVRGYSQCHWFAGLGGWSYALRLAGWDDTRPVWSGSCPCQPFSAAGKGKAADDERHLWPAWFSLIRECRPAAIFGEQVEAAIGWGWLDAVFADLEAEGYACGATVLPACSVGAPHIRQRLWFVGNTECGGSRRRARASLEAQGEASLRPECDGARPSSTDGELADADGGHASAEGLQRSGEHGREQKDGCSDIVAPSEHAERRAERQINGYAHGRDGFGGRGNANPWSDLIWLPCTDGKKRPTQPGIFPLAHGVSARVAKLRAAGNAIVPQVAAAFIKAAM